MRKRHNRNSYVWEQIMQQRIKRILADQKKHPENYFDLGDYWRNSTTCTASSSTLTADDILSALAKLKDDYRAIEVYEDYTPSYEDRLPYLRYWDKLEILQTPWRLPWKVAGGDL